MMTIAVERAALSEGEEPEGACHNAVGGRELEQISERPATKISLQKRL
jgi:hypothetical protein